MKDILFKSIFLVAAIMVFISHCSYAQKGSQKTNIDSELASLVKEVSSDSIKSYIQKMVSFGTRHALSDTTSLTTGIGAARRWVASKFLDFKIRHQANMKVELDPFLITPESSRRIPYAVTMKNVVATLHGTNPDDKRVLLVSGHLDSRNSNVMDSVGMAPGANDDASGVAVVIELARVLSKRKFPCTIIFMAVQGEEQGLLGARHMAEKMKANEDQLIAMLNNDIVGNSEASETGDKNEKTVRIFSEMIPSAETESQERIRSAMKSENDSPSRQLARYIKEISEPYLSGFTATLNMRPDRFLRGGDHTPFLQNGFVAVRFCEFNENFTQQHQDLRTENGVEYGDLLKFVDFKYAANVARMNLVTLASLAKAPNQPEKVEMKVNLGNLTQLSWEAPKTGPAAKGYNVLVRETYQPFWEKKIFVESLTAELPYSKDNYFFAVQAVGTEGHASLMVLPTLSR